MLPLGMPGALKAPSTVEWQKAQVMPTDLSEPSRSKKPFRPTTEFSWSSARVVFGLVRSTLPALSASRTDSGSFFTSTLRPTASAVAGETPSPTPPSLEPSIALCSCSVPPQNAWSPKVSKRKTWRPWATRLLPCAVMAASLNGLTTVVWEAVEKPPRATTAPAATTATRNGVTMSTSIFLMGSPSVSNPRGSCRVGSRGLISQGHPVVVRAGAPASAGKLTWWCGKSPGSVSAYPPPERHRPLLRPKVRPVWSMEETAWAAT